jgi:hypothetical protein
MTINILLHLENIKIFTDYIHSGLDSTEMFWEYIDKGKIFKKDKIKTVKYDVDTSNYEPSKIELEKLKEWREKKESLDFAEEYVNAIRSTIETKLEHDKAEIPETMELQDIYEAIILENVNLKEFLNTSKDIFNQYINIIDAKLPQEFFKKLSQTVITKIEDVEDLSLSIPQIALKYIYERKLINRENSWGIVRQYGHASGDALYNKYIQYSSDANRKGVPHPLTPRKLQNKIELLESIIDLVPTDKQTKIKEEVMGLKRIQEDEFQ